MSEILIRKSGNLADIAYADGRPLPRGLKDLLESALTYTFRRKRFGRAARELGPMETEQRPLYRYDSLGRMVCGYGCTYRAEDVLKAACQTVRRVVPQPDHDRWEPDWDLLMEHFLNGFRPRQEDCLVAVAGRDCGMISAPTGFGKGMVITMLSVLFSKAKIDIAVPGVDLVRDLVDRLSKYLPNIGQVGAGKLFKGERVTVYSADSLHRSDADSDILIVDEGHCFAAPTYAAALARYQNSRNYMLSANTEGRSDGADLELESLFGPVIFHLPYQEAVSLGLVVQMRVEWLDVLMDDNPCGSLQNDIARERHGIWRNDERNRVIAEKANSYEDDDQVLIMVRTLEHALHLRKHLPNFELCYATADSDELDAYRKQGLFGEDEEPLSSAARERMRQDFKNCKLKKVIATTVWSKGVDFANLQVLVRGDAMASTIADTQLPGRACRVDGKKQFGIVVDLMDQFDERFRRKAMTRRKHYEEHGWEQVRQRLVKQR